MGLMDGLVSEVADRFGLGAKAGPLVSALLALLTDEQRGGIPGFLERFRQAGLGSLVASWIGRGGNSELAPDQLEQALGRDTIEQVSGRAGVPAATAKPALAFLVPKVVDLLTPDGAVPAGLPSGLLAGLGGLGAAAGAGLGTAGSTVGRGAREAAGVAGAAAASGGSWARKLLPLLAILLLGYLGYRWLGQGRGPAEGGVAGLDTSAAVSVPAPEPADSGTMDASGLEPAGAGAPADPPAAAEAAMRKAGDALAGLQPGYTADDLVEALNLNIINFASGSAQIPQESHAILDQSAKAIEGAPDGTVLEAGGHTDNTGNAAANQRLSERRAQAVRKYLVDKGVAGEALTAKGYGAAKPVAGNDSEDGRFRNRRIAFTVVK